MPPRPKPARLYLRRSRGDRGAVWVILDAGSEHATGCSESDRGGAEAALARYIADRYRPTHRRDDLSRIPIADVLNVYLREHAPRTSSLSWLLHMAEPLIEHWGARTLADVRASTCHAYVDWRVPQGVTVATARHELKTLRAAINYYHREYGPLPAVPAVTLPAKPQPRVDYYLTRSEVARRLLAAWRDRRTRHVARMILIGVYTGTRPGAILGLRWLPSLSSGWIDLASETIHRRGSDKGESRKRATPARIPPRLLPHLRRWQEIDAKRGRTHVITYKGEPINKLRRSWKTLAGDLDDAPHILRHTAATWLVQAGVSYHDASGYLGMSVETLERHYGHHSVSFQTQAAKSRRK